MLSKGEDNGLVTQEVRKMQLVYVESEEMPTLWRESARSTSSEVFARGQIRKV